MATTVITETKVLWDKPGGRLFVWDHDSNSWAEFLVAADAVSQGQFAAALDLKVAKAGDTMTGPLNLDDALNALGGGELRNMDLIGVGTTADATNPFAAKLNNILFTGKTVAEGGDGSLRFKLNKEAAGATVSQLYQTGFSGRAETGLTGDDDFHIKVSPDGSAWTEALRIDRATGEVTLAVPLSVESGGAGAVSVTQFGAVGDGTTDDYAAFVAALAFAAGRPVYIPPGRYRIDLSDDARFLEPAAGTLMFGAGRQASVLDIIDLSPTANFPALFWPRNGNLRFRDFSVEVTDVAHPDSFVYLWWLDSDAAGLDIFDMRLDGGVAPVAGTHNWRVIVFGTDTGTGFSDLSLRRCEATRVMRVTLRVNAATSTMRRWQFIGNHIHDNFAGGLNHNNPFGVWEDILVLGNTIADIRNSEVGGTDLPIRIGIAHARRVRIIGNRLEGKGRGLHIEGGIEDFVIAGNLVECVTAEDYGMLLGESSPNPVTPTRGVIHGNTFKGPGAGVSTNRGIWMTFDGNGIAPVGRTTVTGNVIEGFDIGIAATYEDKTIFVHHNIIRDCNTGLLSARPLVTMEDNWLIDCAVGLKSTGRGGLWGRQRFANVAAWVEAPTNERGSLKGWEATFDIDLPGSTATDINLAARGLMVSGTLRLDWHHAANRYRTATRQIAYDGTTFTDVDELSGGDGGVALTGIVDNAGNIAARFTNTEATARDGGTLTAAFDGLHVIV